MAECVESLLPQTLPAAREEMILLLGFPSQLLVTEQQACLRNQAWNTVANTAQTLQ